MQPEDRRQVSSAGIGAMVSLLLGLLAGQLAGQTPSLAGVGWGIVVFVAGHVLLGLFVALRRPQTVMAAAVGTCVAWALLGALSLPRGLPLLVLSVVWSVLTMVGGGLGTLLRRLLPDRRA